MKSSQCCSSKLMSGAWHATEIRSDLLESSGFMPPNVGLRTNSFIPLVAKPTPGKRLVSGLLSPTACTAGERGLSRRDDAE